MHDKLFGRTNELLGKIHLSTFEIFLGIALVVFVYYFIYALEKKNKYSKEKTNKFLVLLAIALLVTFLSALFFDALFHYFNGEAFELGGITYIVGFLGGIITFGLLIYFFMKDERKNIIHIFNVIIPGVILAHAIGRLGCFSVGCCYGLPTDSIFGVLFPEGTVAYNAGHTSHLHPTQLYESFFLFGLFFLLKFKYFRKNEFGFYLIFYGVFRFVLEISFRGDNRGEILGVAPSMLLSIVLVVLGIMLIVYSYKARNKAVML